MSHTSPRRAWWASRSTCSARRSAIERFDGLDDAGVQRAPPLLEQAAVGHLVGERVLEGVLRARGRGSSRTGTRRPGGARGRGAAPPRAARRWPAAARTARPCRSPRRSGAGACPPAAAGRCARPGPPAPWPAPAMLVERLAPGDRRRARPTSTPVSTSVRTLSSRKNGLPSVRSISSCLSGCEARVVARAAPAAAPRRSPGGSGSSRSCV